MFRANRIGCILVFCGLVVAALAADPKKILLVADEWVPFNATPNSSQEGYIIDIARAVFEPKGYVVEYRIVPWDRALDGLKTGLYDGAVGASKADAAGAIFPEEELAINRLGFFTTLASTWVFRERGSISSQSLAVIDGYDYRKWLTDYIASNRADHSRIQIMTGDNPLARNLQKMLLGRVDVVVDSVTAVRYTAMNLGILDKIRLAGADTEPAYIYIAFSAVRANSGELAHLLSEGIKFLRKSGKLKVILDRYGLQDWKK